MRNLYEDRFRILGYVPSPDDYIFQLFIAVFDKMNLCFVYESRRKIGHFE